jgi:hypothetical protein
MHYRHSNRTRHDLPTNRVALDRPPEIDSLQLPKVLLGRYVDFDKNPAFEEYVHDVAEDKINQKGISKGWFKMADKPLFVEYADLTAGLKTVVQSRARPRSYQQSSDKIIDRLASDVRVAAKSHSDHVERVNAERGEAIAAAVATDDHAEEMQEFWEMFGDVSSRWGSATFQLLKQPKPVKLGEDSDGVLQYGFPVIQEVSDQELRSDLIGIVKTLDIPVPNQLIKGVRPVVPIINLHRELSGMHGNEPVLPIPPTVELGPIGIHRF